MVGPDTPLHGFAYGEDVDGLPPRSLGYRLLAPAQPRNWSGEVETLARRLQAIFYPDPWPPTDLFCSLLLADGQRLVAVARYGLADHTASRRRGGLELIGVVGPAELPPEQALAVYRWLRQRRGEVEGLRGLGDSHRLGDVLASAPPAQPPEQIPVLPVRIWEKGALLFAATAPSDPDHRLGLLAQETGAAWQWLPLCGVDFPLQTYAERGSLVAWTPHLTDVAVKLNNPPHEGPPRPLIPRRRLVGALLWALALALLAGNLWATLTLLGRLPDQKENKINHRGTEDTEKTRREGENKKAKREP